MSTEFVRRRWFSTRSRRGRLTWEPAPHAPVLLRIPSAHGSAVEPSWRLDIDGRTVWAVTDWAWQGEAPPATPDGTCLLLTRLSRPLESLLVMDDFHQDPSRLVTVDAIHVPIPADDDPYDGRRWRVHASDEEFGRTVLDDRAWAMLQEHARRHVVRVWTDGAWLCTERPGRHLDSMALDLLEFATLLDRKLAAGSLERWTNPPDAAAVRAPRIDPDNGWELVTAPRSMVGALRLAGGQSIDQVWRGNLDGIDFHVARVWIPRHLALSLVDGTEEYTVVMLRTPRVLRHHVWFARRGPLRRPGNVRTEWLDFDEAYTVSAKDERVGHAVSNPRLMAYLYDNRVRRLEVSGGWLMGRVKFPEPWDVQPMVRVLAGARELLPRHDPEQLPTTRG